MAKKKNMKKRSGFKNKKYKKKRIKVEDLEGAYL